jgi:hypothetical protein
VVYEMLSGQLPHRGRAASLIHHIVSSEPVPPTLANPELPQDVESVLLQALDKDPEKRHPSCAAFASELEQAAQAYIVASERYEQAQELLESRQWRRALAAFEALERQAPGFKDAARHLERAGFQVRLLKLYKQAQEALERGQYRDALDTLNILTGLAPDYDVGNLHQRAREGLAQEEERQALDERYQQAVRQFRRGEYQVCLDTLAAIRERDPDYRDREGIEALAQERAEHQWQRSALHLSALYTQGMAQMRQERWEEAILTFQALQHEAPGYEDVETRLAMARRMAQLSSLLREARTFMEYEAFAACVDKLDELQRIDANYKSGEVAQLRQEALRRLQETVEDRAGVDLCINLYNQALAALAEKEPHRSLELWRRIHEVDPRYPDDQRVEQRAQAMIERREQTRRWAFRLGGGAAALLVVGVVAVVLMRGRGGAALPPTATPTGTLASTATSVRPSATPAPTQPLSSTATPVPPSATPRATPTRTPSPPPTVATPSATPTSTAPPTPTRTPTLAATATPVPPRATVPEPLAPSQGGTYQNPIAFQWRGSLSAGQSYRVTARHLESGHVIQSELLTDQSWTVDLPPERYAEWRWTVSVVQGGREVATSSEWMLWFNPRPGGDDGGGGGGEGPTPPPP